jgi:hypothetical protein
MKRDSLIALCSGYPYFDLPFLRQMTGERSSALNLNIKRWLANGTLLPLRRGLYALADHLRKADISAPRLANDLYPPSYLTDVWALSFYGLIPDVAREYTSATPRRPQSFTNVRGVFTYRHLAASYFWGFLTMRIKESDFRCASPEKALIDHWYWSPGEWTSERLRELRLQNLEQLDLAKLQAAVTRMGKPRIERAFRRLLPILKEEQE